MAFEQFNNDQYWKTSDTGEEIRMGFFSGAEGGLAHLKVLFHGQGMNSTTNETLRLKIYSDSTTSSDTLLYTSEEAQLSDIDYTTDNWLGFLRCDFNQENINKNFTYYVNAEFLNYTRGTTVFGLCYDYPISWYTTPGATTFFEENIAFLIFTYE